MGEEQEEGGTLSEDEIEGIKVYASSRPIEGFTKVVNNRGPGKKEVLKVAGRRRLYRNVDEGGPQPLENPKKRTRELQDLHIFNRSVKM